MIKNKSILSKLSLIVLFVLILSTNIYAVLSNYIVKFDDGTKSRLQLTNLNNIEYISLNDLAKVVFQKAKVNAKKDELIFNNKKIKFSPLSFYANYSNETSNKIIQFRRPCISYANNLLIPFNSMLIALEVLQIYSPSIDKDIIYLNRYKQAEAPDSIKTIKKVAIEDNITSEYSKDYNPKRNFYAFIVDSENNTKTQNENNHQNIKSKIQIVEKVPPNNYLIPKNLKRKLGENLKYDKSKINPDNIFATKLKTKKNNDSSIQIVKIYAEIKNNSILIHLYSNNIIEQYQRPECDSDKLTIRIPNVTDNISDYSLALNLAIIKSIKPRRIREFQIYTVEINDIIKKCSSKRNGPKELIFTIIPENPIKQKKKVIISKSSSSIEKKVAPKKEKEIEQKKPVKSKAKNDFSDEKKKWDLDCIVLDPGHGGKDAGAVSISGIYEKDITLKIAKKVKALLKEKMPHTRVVMTRNDDRFIELYKRGQIANNENGKLFISIHLNSARKKPSDANGFETYILRPGKNKDAIRVANFENSAIKFEKKTKKYKTLTDEELIIATMAQSSFVKFSELFARLMQSEVGKTTGLKNRGVKQAGFYVLIGASMPNVLFEAGFLSNKKDEKYISSDEGINQTALGIVNAIIKYADEYKKF